ncbi:MAG TPA: amidohydrolase family protein [Candidatus Binatia bacterium]|nr:amidohydrolase family protein [Candidatus Binatia bacterium]
MSSNGHVNASGLHARLRHPIIDADGHWLEFGPTVREQLRKIGGDRAVDGFSLFGSQVAKELSMSVAERRARRIAQQAFWGLPAKNTRDRATAMMPRLLYERMEELGLDFTVLYPTAGLGIPRIEDAELRRLTCRAFNVFSADYFGAFSDRMTPAAVIPMHTPEEAIAELEHAVTQLGLKVVMMGSMMRRPIPAVAEKHPDMAKAAAWFDPLGLDSEYDYDPVWAKCVELGVSPSFHTGGRGYGLRVSPTNFTYNHIGHFAVANEAVCKALFMGGVTRRFPRLKFAFLEGGVGWACQLYADLIGHWEKRNLEALEEVNPKNLDHRLLLELAEKYGGSGMAEVLRRREAALDTAVAPQGATITGGIDNLDDYAACQIKRPEDLRDLFVDNFYFGCEADDPMNAWAFNRRGNPFAAQLNALFGSDIGHFDVPNMAHVVPEAYELVEDGLISEDDFRDFVFANPVRFWGEANPNFFQGTAVEAAAAALLTRSSNGVERTAQLSK